MNVFALDIDPTAAAARLHDDHLGSQGGEAVQVLSDAAARLSRWAPWMRQPYNPHGRFAKWAATYRANAAWLVDHGLGIMHELAARQCRREPAGVAEALMRFGTAIQAWPKGDLTPFAMCKATERHYIEIVRDGAWIGEYALRVEAYRRMYAATKMTSRGKPSTWTPNQVGPFVVGGLAPAPRRCGIAGLGYRLAALDTRTV